MSRVFRTDRAGQTMNAGKAQKVAGFMRDFRSVATAIGPIQWRLFFEKGATNARHPAKQLNSVCGAAPVQMASHQVAEQLDSWISNRANDFIDLVRHSSLPDETRKALYKVNRDKAWFSREPLKDVPDDVRLLARRLMRHAMSKHRRPDLSKLSPRLDNRVASVATSRKAKHASLWARLTLPRRGRIEIPLHPSALLQKRGGNLCPIVQLCDERDGSIGVRLVSDIGETCAATVAAYQPLVESVGIDFGLVTLLVTDRGDLMGRGLFNALKHLDKLIVGIARHRRRLKEKPRSSARYRRIVARVRGLLRTRINAALNHIIAIHRPAVLSIERLEFRVPGLSKRMNRILSNCGRSAFKAKLMDLQERFGVVAEEVPAPYTSQECSSCHYVDRRNRRSQSRFVCRFCGCTKHADVNGACAITGRRSSGLGVRSMAPGAILVELVRRFNERYRQSQGAAADPRWSNPYFKGWASAARALRQPLGFVPCALKQ